MTLEEFDLLARTKDELIAFLERPKQGDFVGIASSSLVFNHNHYSMITNREIVNEIIQLVETRLNEINKKIERL